MNEKFNNLIRQNNQLSLKLNLFSYFYKNKFLLWKNTIKIARKRYVSGRVECPSGRVEWVTDREKWVSGRVQWVTDRMKWASGRVEWVTDRVKRVTDREKWASGRVEWVTDRVKRSSNSLEIHLTDFVIDNSYSFSYTNDKLKAIIESSLKTIVLKRWFSDFFIMFFIYLSKFIFISFFINLFW